MYSRQFEELVAAFRRLPGTGGKTAEKYAYALIDWTDEQYDEFIKSLMLGRRIKHCKVCQNLSDSELCPICEDHNRNHKLICVVAHPKDVASIENMESYDGVYHVLNGLISTSKGILPDKLNIDELEQRINEDTEEVILALDPTMEGETTSLYLTKLLEDKVKVTKLASGIPMGGKLDYIDSLTLEKAFEGRKKS